MKTKHILVACCLAALLPFAAAQKRDESEVVRVHDSDADMAAAIKEARRTLPA